MKIFATIATLIFLLCGAVDVRAEGVGEFRVGTGVDFSSGSYGESEETEILSIPFTMRYVRFPWTFRASIPWTQIKGPEDVVAGADGPVLPGESTTIATDSGIGDLVLAAVYSIDPWNRHAPGVDLTVKAKLPTADEDKRLGTGKADYSVQIDLTKSWGAWSPFATLGYQFMGSSDELPLDDRAYGSLGFSVLQSRSLSLGLAYDYRQSSSDRADDSHEIGAFGTWRLRPFWRISPYASLGLSDGAPDWNIGMQTQYTF